MSAILSGGKSTGLNPSTIFLSGLRRMGEGISMFRKLLIVALIPLVSLLSGCSYISVIGVLEVRSNTIRNQDGTVHKVDIIGVITTEDKKVHRFYIEPYKVWSFRRYEGTCVKVTLKVEDDKSLSGNSVSESASSCAWIGGKR
jgi:hypothetical protein